MPSPNKLDSAQQTRFLKIPVVPGYDPVRRAEIAQPLPAPDEPAPAPEAAEKPTRRMWAKAGAVVLASSVSLAWAFAQREPAQPAAPPICKVVAAREVSESIVTVRLDLPPGNEQVWVGNDTGVMEAQRLPGDAAAFSVNTFGYLHNAVIGVYVGNEFCNNRFDLGTVHPGDEQFFAG
jgi:hypothetical protein